MSGIYKFKTEIKREIEKTGKWCKVRIDRDGEVTGMKSSEDWRYSSKTDTGGRRYVGNIYDKSFQDYWEMEFVSLLSDIPPRNKGGDNTGRKRINKF